MTSAVEPLRATRHYFKLSLNADPNEPTAHMYAINLYVNNYWWEHFSGKDKLSEGEYVFISVNQDDLRIRHLPREMSQLRLLGRSITINHHADGLMLLINARIQITEVVKNHSGQVEEVTGVLKSGSMKFSQFKETFLTESEWHWLSAGQSEQAELFLGSSRVQLCLLRETDSGKKKHLYEYVGAIQQKEADHLWRLVDCPHYDYYSPQEIIEAQEKQITEAARHVHVGKAIEVEKLQGVDGSVYSRIYYENEADKKATQKDYFTPALRVLVFQEDSEKELYGSPFIWTPQGLETDEKGGKKRYILSDENQVAMLLNGVEPHVNTDYDLTIHWKVGENRDRRVTLSSEDSERRLLFLTHPTNPDIAFKQRGKHYFWGPARWQDSSAEVSWLRYSFEAAPATSEINESSTLLTNSPSKMRGALLRFSGLNVSQNSKEEDWTLFANIPDMQDPQNHPRIRLEVLDDRVVLKIHRPQLLAISPEMRFFAAHDDKLIDSASMPAQPLWSKHLRSSQLVFQNELSPSKLGLAKRSIQLNCDKESRPELSPRLDEEATAEQMVFFKRAPLAVIDRVSPARNNLSSQESEEEDPHVTYDPSHGFLPFQISNVQYSLSSEIPTVKVDPQDIQASEKYSTEALLPWVERKFSDFKEELKLYHRNLVLEHSEYATAQGYQQEETVYHGYLASQSFVQAVRDRYCLAAIFNEENQSDLLNWFPGSSFQGGRRPKVTYEKAEEGSNSKKLPQIKLQWNPPLENEEESILSIADRRQNWLDYLVKPTFDESNIELEIKPLPEDEVEHKGFFHAANSSAPLLFSADKYSDNLGVIRQNSLPTLSEKWHLKKIFHHKFPSKKCFSISTMNQELSHESSQAGEFKSGVTQIFFSCDELKVDASGKVISPGSDKRFHTSDLNLGVFGFYSHIRAIPGSSLSCVDHWPRYSGIPFLVTEIEELHIIEDLDAEGEVLKPRSIKFKAVFANPEQLGLHVDTATIPNFIYHSLLHQSTVSFEYAIDSKSLKLVQPSSVSWNFSQSKQQSKLATSGYINQLTGKIQHKNQRVQLVVNQSTAEALGKNWAVKPTKLVLEPQSLFLKLSEKEYLQLDYQFSSQGFLQRCQQIHQSAVLAQQGKIKIRAVDFLVKDITFCHLRSASGKNEAWLSHESIYSLNENNQDYLICTLGADFELIGSEQIECTLYSISLDFSSEELSESKIVSRGTFKRSDPTKIKVLEEEITQIHDIHGSICQLKSHGKHSYHLIDSYATHSSETQSDHFFSFDSLYSAVSHEFSEGQFSVYESPTYLLISSTLKEGLVYHLPLDLTLKEPLPELAENSDQDLGENLESYISSQGRLILYLKSQDKEKDRTKLLNIRLVQEDVFCFLIHGKETLRQRELGENALVLWCEAEGLAGMVIRNLFQKDPYYSFFLKGNPLIPCSQEIKAGIKVDYFKPKPKDSSAKTNKSYRYTVLSLSLSFSLKGIRYYLRFDDQDFSGLNLDPVEGKFIRRTGYLQIQDQEGGEVQGPVVAKLENKWEEGVGGKKVKKVIICIEECWFSINEIQHAAELQEFNQPDVVSIYRNEGQTSQGILEKCTFFQALPVKKQGTENRFAALVHTDQELKLLKIDEDLVPINFCLEPESVSSTTKLEKTAPQTIHRQVFGNIPRLKIDDELYQRTINTNEKISMGKSKWLLSPITKNSAEKLQIMSDHAFLKREKLLDDNLSAEAETESILVFNRPIAPFLTRSSDSTPFIALSNKTGSITEEENAKQDQIKVIQQLALENGASGVIIRRKVTHLGHVRYEFVPSPFYLGGYPNSATSFNQEDQFKAVEAEKLVDFRALLPEEIMRIEQIDHRNAYVPMQENHSSDSSKCCNFERTMAYEYRGEMAQAYPNHQQPTVYLYETPAFKSMEPLWYLSARENQMVATTAADWKNEDQTFSASYFLPHKFFMRFGSDKPGAMFHHELRTVTHIPNPNEPSTCRIGPLIDFAMREAQRIKTQGCVSAAVENVEFVAKEPNEILNTSIITSHWQDILGRIELGSMNNHYRIELTKREYFQFRCVFPLKTIVLHNYDLFALDDLNRALPIYYDEDINRSDWARYFLVSRSDTLTHPDMSYSDSIDDPSTGERQELIFNFHPYLMLAEVDIKIGLNSIEIVNSQDATCIKDLNESLRDRRGNPILKFSVEGMKTSLTQQQEVSLWELGDLTGQTLKFKDVQEIHGQNAAEKLIVCVDLNLVLANKISSNGFHLWEFDLSKVAIFDTFSQFQILWLAPVDYKTEISELGNRRVQQVGSCPFYTYKKQLKKLSRAITSPKTAGVLHVEHDDKQYKKTLFFGDAANADEAKMTLEVANDKKFAKCFVNAAQSTEVAFPVELVPVKNRLSEKFDFPGKVNFFVIKYLIHGQVVYGEPGSGEDAVP